MTPEDLGKSRLFYSIQAGAFLDKQRAQTRLEELQAKQYPAYLVSAWDDKRQLWHTVRVGRFADLTEARLAARALSRKEQIDAQVYGIGSLRYDELPEPAAATPPGQPPPPKTKTSTKEP